MPYKSKYFPISPMQILFDTCGWTTDINQTEQLSLSVRFTKDTKVHEEFLCFVPVSSTTGKDLASTILTQLSQLGLNLEHMRGRRYDGASNMSGNYHGVQARVKELYPLAMHTHCCNHVLNLVISASSPLPVIRNAMATISDICVFLSRSAQRVSIFQDKTMLKEKFQARLLRDRSWNQFVPHAG